MVAPGAGLRGWDIVYHIVPLGAARLWRQPIITGDPWKMTNLAEKCGGPNLMQRSSHLSKKECNNI